MTLAQTLCVTLTVGLALIVSSLLLMNLAEHTTAIRGWNSPERRPLEDDQRPAA